MLQIQTDKGRIEGFTINGVSKFLGIPFAKPPLAERRFLPPEECDPWSGVLETKALKSSPMQPLKAHGRPSRSVGEMSEDCLYLNVYAPADAQGRALPVMYWFYGGGYTVGSASMPVFEGEKFVANNDVILVTANYRVGIFGFMSHPLLQEKAAHATNAGVADAIMGLTWVKKNIAAFGGNPDNVTIFGQSAGSSLVNLLMISPPAKGLFHAVITQSGSPFNHDEWDIDTKGAYEKCERFLKKIGIDSWKELYSVSAEYLVKNQVEYALAEFCPYVDGDLLRERLEPAFLKGQFVDVPVMLGCTRDEAFSLVNGGDAHGSQRQTTKEDFLKTVNTKYPIAEHKEFIINKYGPYASYDPGYALARFRSDNTTANMRYFASCLKEHNISEVYYYLFEHVPPTQDPSFLGAHHGCEVSYVFQTLAADQSIIAYGENDEVISQQVARYWSNFARNHHPNSEQVSHWEAFTPENDLIMYLNNPCECTRLKNKGITDRLEQFLAQRTETNNPGLMVKCKRSKR